MNKINVSNMKKVNWGSVVKSLLILLGMIGSGVVVYFVIDMLTVENILMIFLVCGVVFLWYVIYDLVEWKRKGNGQ